MQYGLQLVHVHAIVRVDKFSVDRVLPGLISLGSRPFSMFLLTLVLFPIVYNFQYEHQHQRYGHVYDSAARSIDANPSRSDRLCWILLEDEPRGRTNVTVCWSWLLFYGILCSLQIMIGLHSIEVKYK